MMVKEKTEMSIGEWLRIGLENNFCTEIACQTHDVVGYTTEEETEFEEGGDPCVFIVRINTEMSSEYPFGPKPEEHA